MNRLRSQQLFARAQQRIPGGVNSPVRAFKSVGGEPVFIESAKGSRLYDADGNNYIDYINSWGPMILGHAHPDVVEAIQRRASEAISFGAPTETEIEMAELVCKMVPSVQSLRLVNSGTEACMSALRLARGFTGRNKVVKFEGCYHGHSDAFLAKSGSGVATLNIQSVPGVPATVVADTLTIPFNDIDAFEAVFAEHGPDIAAVIIEPVAGNMGCIPPMEGYLQALRDRCTKEGAVLIFDEVMTGFRLAPGGAQELYGMEADLVTYGKVIGGGMPIGAFGGRADIMGHIAPLGQVYQAGTLSGNPIAVAAGYATLRVLDANPGIYPELARITRNLHQALKAAFEEIGMAVTINRIGSMISVHFGSEPIRNFADAAASGVSEFNRFFHHMLDNGIYLPPSAYETWFISTAISDDDIALTAEAVRTFS